MELIDPDLAAVSAIVNYSFNDETLITRALTHRSVSHGKDHGYERLEFLGDRVLGLCVADLLMSAFPDEPEGDLSRRFNALVRQETLAEIASHIGLKNHILLGKSEQDSGAANNPAIISDVCESVIAALYLDGGMDVVRAFIFQHWQPRLEKTSKPPKDAKSSLQEWAMARKLPIPAYEEIIREGPDHAPIFTIQVTVKGRDPEQAEGDSKRLAEQKAAALLLEKVTRDD